MNVRINEQTIKRVHTRRQRQRDRNVCERESMKGGRGKPCCSNDGMSVCGYLLRSYNCVACIFSLSPSLSVFFVCLLHTRRIGFSFKRQIHKTNERFVNNKNALLFDESGIQRVCVCVCVVFRMRDQSEKTCVLRCQLEYTRRY